MHLPVPVIVQRSLLDAGQHDPAGAESVALSEGGHATFASMVHPPRASRLHERLEDLCREAGTLLLTFTPLDAVLWSDKPNRGALTLTFLFFAVLLITAAF